MGSHHPWRSYANFTSLDTNAVKWGPVHSVLFCELQCIQIVCVLRGSRAEGIDKLVSGR